MAPPDVLNLSVSPEDAGLRLDAYVSQQVTECTRSHAALLIRQGNILVDGASTKPSYKVKTREQITVEMPPPEPVDLVAEPMDLDILFEDRHLIVINKPAGLVVHPAAGHPTGTLVNGILHHCPDLEGIGGEMRPGIIHRLDKDTSGVMVVAKTAQALAGLADQFKSRSVVKQYLALVHGVPKEDSGSIDLPVGRHPVDRKKMSTRSAQGREALTLWKIESKFNGAALLAVDLKTGRTHQIRVHCYSMGHPLIGDPVYGFRRAISNLAKHNKPLYLAAKRAARQMLHAHKLGFTHPVNGDHQQFGAPIPEDMGSVIKALRF